MTSFSRSLAGALCGAILSGSVSCAGSPNTPTPTITNISGSWAGTWTFTTAGAIVTDAVSVTLTQNGTMAAGPWSAASGPGGQLTLAVGSGLIGSASISQSVLGGTCAASTTVTGTATSTRVEITLGTFPPSGVCQWGTNQQFILTR